MGDILYSDKTCSSGCKISSKTPIGVVSYINGSTRLAVQLNYLGYMFWSSDSGTCKYQDISGIANYSSSSAALNDFSGKSNTKAYHDTYGDSCTNYAPGYCYNYTTAGTSKGDWYLPAAGELYGLIVTNYSAVNSGLSAAGGSTLSGFHWSSSEEDGYTVWNTGTGGVFHNYKYGNSALVRCVLAF